MTKRIKVDDELSLVELRPKDAEPLFCLIDSDREHLSQYLDETSERYPTLESVRTGITNPADHETLRLGIWDKDTLVGSIKLARRSELGYWLGSAHQGNGYVTRAGRALCDYGFRVLKLNSIVAFAHRENAKSHRVLDRLGFECKGPTIMKGLLYSPTALTFVLRPPA